MSLIHVTSDVVIIRLKHLRLSCIIICIATICLIKLTTLIDGAGVVAFGEHRVVLEESCLDRAHLADVVEGETVDVLHVDQSADRGFV